MKEYPLIFSSESVQSIRDGRKSQTRRVLAIKDLQQWNWEARPHPSSGRLVYADLGGQVGWWDAALADEVEEFISRKGRPPRSPFRPLVPGREPPPGSRLWVRERFQVLDGAVTYAADGGDGPWRSPIYMPRWASRITLEVVREWAEELLSISSASLIAEGFAGRGDLIPGPIPLIADFIRDWDTLNAKRGYPWSSNPWVKVIEFRDRGRGMEAG